MVSAEVVIRQVKRLSGLQFFPREEEPQAELYRALQVACTTPEHACAVVDAWLESSAVAPAPSQIYELANAKRVTYTPPQEICPECAGTGWIIRYCVVRTDDDGKRTLTPVTRQYYSQVRSEGVDVTEAAERCAACSKAGGHAA